jgi:hypothetical protein
MKRRTKIERGKIMSKYANAKVAQDCERMEAIKALYCRLTGDETHEEDWLTDLLADLQHYCTSEEIDFDYHMDAAREHWRYEQDPMNKEEIEAAL